MNEQSADSPRPFDSRWIGTLAIAVAVVCSTAIAAGSWRDVRKGPDKHNIKVTGSARKRIVSDLISWNAVIEGRAADRTDAYRIVREGRDKAMAFLAAQGIKPEEIQPQSANVEEVFESLIEQSVLPGTTTPVRTEKKISKGFKATDFILVRSTDVARVEKASREITALLEQGVDVTSNDPEYFYTRLGELKLEMLAAAAKDARSRAEKILGSAGNAEVGKLVVADMGIININAANSTKTSEEGNNDTSALEKDIITIVHTEFEVK